MVYAQPQSMHHLYPGASTSDTAAHKTFSVDHLQHRHSHGGQPQQQLVQQQRTSQQPQQQQAPQQQAPQQKMPSDKWEPWTSGGHYQTPGQTFHIETMFPETRQAQSTPHHYAPDGYCTYYKYDTDNYPGYPMMQTSTKGFMPNFCFHQPRE